MRRLFPPSDLSEVLAADVRTDGPGAADGDTALSDEDLLHEYAYPAGRSWLRVNMVGAIDGVATVQGLSEGLSGGPDKRVFGLLRALADVVVVGAGTARTENYRGARVSDRFAGLRASLGQEPQPPIAVVSRHLGLDPDAALFTDTKVRPVLLTCDAAPGDQRALLGEVADIEIVGDTDVELTAVREVLEKRGFTRLLSEGGPSLLHDLVGERLLDELCLTTSPQLVGGGERHVLNGPAFADPLPARLAGLLEDDGVLFARYLMER